MMTRGSDEGENPPLILPYRQTTTTTTVTYEAMTLKVEKIWVSRAVRKGGGSAVVLLGAVGIWWTIWWGLRIWRGFFGVGWGVQDNQRRLERRLLVGGWEVTGVG